MTRERRRFVDVDISTIKTPTPFAIGLYGYAGAGKTESACRLARGLLRVYGGDVILADTDGGRALAYKEMYPWLRYIAFPPPHNALDFSDLIEQYTATRRILIIDQMTEEHDGEDGLLDTAERIREGKDSRNAKAFAVAKGQHKVLARTLRKAIGAPHYMPIICCWRAQQKTDWGHKNSKGAVEPVSLGEMPIGSRDLPYEMVVSFLLRPGSRGRPLLQPATLGEEMMTKIPRWFADLVHPDPERPGLGEQLTEAHGEAMARWAMAGASAPQPTAEFQQLIADTQTFRLEEIGAFLAVIERAIAERALTPGEAQSLRDALKARAAQEPDLKAALAALKKPAPKPTPAAASNERREREPGEDG